MAVSKKTRVLFVSHNMDYEGAPLFLLTLARKLDRARYEVFILSTKDGPLRERYLQEEITVLMSKIQVRNISVEGFKIGMKRLTDDLAPRNLDLVVCNTLNTFYGIYLARLMGLSSLWCIHEDVNFHHHFMQFCGDRRLVDLAIACFKIPVRLIFVSHSTAKKYGDAGNDALKVIHNGIDVKMIDAYKVSHTKDSVRKRFDISRDAKVITVVGTICDRKGQRILVQSAIRLLKKMDNLRFYLVGARGGDYLATVRSFIDQYGAGESIRIVPETPDVYPYYRMSDIFICPSFEESFPLVILEAMAFELPIIASDIPGIAEQVQHNESGLLIAPGDAKALANAMHSMLDNERRAQALAASAYRRVLSLFSLERMVESYDVCLRESLGKEPGNYQIAAWRGRGGMLFDRMTYLASQYCTAVRRAGFMPTTKRSLQVMQRKFKNIMGDREGRNV